MSDIYYISLKSWILFAAHNRIARKGPLHRKRGLDILAGAIFLIILEPSGGLIFESSFHVVTPSVHGRVDAQVGTKSGVGFVGLRLTFWVTGILGAFEFGTTESSRGGTRGSAELSSRLSPNFGMEVDWVIIVSSTSIGKGRGLRRGSGNTDWSNSSQA